MRRLLAPVLIAAAALAGCSVGAGPEQKGGGAELRVTRDFGKQSLSSARAESVRKSDTVMRLLQKHVKVTTRYGGGFVQSIDGVAGNERGGRHDWFYFVNGTEAPTGAADRTLAPGDVVQWDYRRWDATPHVPAIVGAFPEPFVHGQEGKRFPTRIECPPGESHCDEVQKKLTDVGVPAGVGSLGSVTRGEILRIDVGKWADLAAVQDLSVLEEGPAKSGVYARFEGPGQLTLLDAEGRPARRLGAGSGLVAAIKPEGQEPLWVVTGTDDAGVERAVAQLAAGPLRNAYAVAVTASGPVRLPVGEGSG
jgi:hypothetical protein